MAITFLVGVLLIRIFLGFGEGVYAVIALTGSSIGIAEILKETVRGATVSQLGKSYYSNKSRYFQEIYSSTMLLSLICACFSALILGLFIVLLSYFNIPENLTYATKYYITTRIIYVFLSITLAPIHNMMPITGRMMSYNVWLTLDRASDLVSALGASYLIISGSAAEQLIMFSSISLMLKLVVLLLATLWSAKFDKKYIPKPNLISKPHLKQIGQLISWNAAAVISVNLYLRFDLIAVNILYGIKATVIFGLASQLAAYINMSSMGFISGLDAVVTQLSKHKGKKQKNDIYSLSKDIIELQALILGFLFVVLTLHSEYIIRFLFEDRINASIDVNMIVICFFILMSGLVIRSMSEGWMGILTGMGNIKAYALPVLLGAMINPVLVWFIGHYYNIEHGLYYICFLFLALNLFFHMYYIPKVTAATLDVRTIDLIKPVFIPFGLTLAAITFAYGIGKLIHLDIYRLMATLFVTSLIVGVYFLIRLSTFFKKQPK